MQRGARQAQQACYLGAVVDSLQDGGEVGSVLRAVLPALGHDPVAAWHKTPIPGEVSVIKYT